MPHSYLPKKKSGTENRFPDPPAVRVWDERPNTHLEALADAIETPPAEQRIHSIPDPWARAILFERALYDEKHLLHTAVLGEWRGLLALLGLRERRKFLQLRAREVKLGAAVTGTFPSVLEQLRPAHTGFLRSDASWQTLYVFRWQKQAGGDTRGRAFALTSPTTLVCTGADYSDVLTTDEVSWFSAATRDGRPLLRDPTEHLSAGERRALAEWVLVLVNELGASETKSPLSNRMMKVLGAFASALDPAVAAAPVEALSEASLGLHEGLYRLLDHPRKAGQALSDVEIVTSRAGPTRYVLIEPSIAQQWGQPAREITIHGDVTLATPERLQSGDTTSGAIEPELRWCTARFFFADRLIYEANPQAAFPGCLPVKVGGVPQSRSVVLPLTPDVLTLFTPHEVAERLSIEWLPNGGAVCSLQLMLRSGSGRDRSVRIQRTYQEADMTSIANLPLVGIWPNFRLDGVKWLTYYTFQFWPGAKEELAVKPWSAEGPLLASRKHGGDGQSRRFQIDRTGSYPEALLCETPFFNPLKQREDVARGVLLLQMPQPEQPPPSSEIVLGVDFGSTGSNVYMRNGSGLPEPVKFEARIRSVTDFDINKFYDTCRDLFIPAKACLAESILSVFQDFGDPAEGAGHRRVLRDGHILFADDPSKFISGDRKRVMSNLKWGAERERIAARDFLMQLCLQAAAEVAVLGATKAKIRFSYPTAFSGNDLVLFFNHWNAVTEMVTNLTGVTLEHDSGQNTSEAIAATRFFSDANANSHTMDVKGDAITVDIGGGTTDLAVWNSQDLLAHSSVIFAGRDIFLAPLRRKPQTLADLDQSIELGMLKGELRDPAFDAQLDAIVSRHGAAMLSNLGISQARASVQGFLQILEVGLCGLMFYAGLLARKVAQDGAFGKSKRLSIFVGGNGSKMFSWCALGGPLALSDVHGRAVQSFLRGAGFENIRVDIQLSTKPKAEVAYGLVLDAIGDGNIKPPSLLLAGEHFTVGSDARIWSDTPAAAEILRRQVSVDRAFPFFSQFLETLEQSPDDDLLHKIGKEVDVRLVKQAPEVEKAKRENPKSKEKDLLRNEPIFIMALKRYVEMEIDAWERRS